MRQHGEIYTKKTSWELWIGPIWRLEKHRPDAGSNRRQIFARDKSATSQPPSGFVSDGVWAGLYRIVVNRFIPRGCSNCEPLTCEILWWVVCVCLQWTCGNVRHVVCVWIWIWQNAFVSQKLLRFWCMERVDGRFGCLVARDYEVILYLGWARTVSQDLETEPICVMGNGRCTLNNYVCFFACKSSLMPSTSTLGLTTSTTTTGEDKSVVVGLIAACECSFV